MAGHRAMKGASSNANNHSIETSRCSSLHHECGRKEGHGLIRMICLLRRPLIERGQSIWLGREMNVIHLSIQSRSRPRRIVPHYARIKLTSSNIEQLDRLANEIKAIAEKTGVKCKGPQPLPTKRLKITTRKAPTGEGTHTFDHWQMRIHRRILDIEPDDRTMKQITKLEIPEDVKIEVILTT